MLALIGGTAYVFLRAAKRAVTSVVPQKREEMIDISALVTQVRELNRLETASMHVLHVSTIQQSYTMVPNALGGDEITFLAAGDVIAGIDLSQLKQHDVWREPDGTLVLRMPPAQVLVTRVDNRESRVLNRKTGVLRRADQDLETRARQHAESEIRAEALRKGIIALAQTNGEKKLSDLMRTLGFRRVKFVTLPAAAPSPR
ncbi:MAG TPA: DUF4230 domain-containing protein [Thermoanaerobaculia bacterium]|nr:DUF4230 domain-containing protein [Thermoanaerobaculia bacterium]